MGKAAISSLGRVLIEGQFCGYASLAIVNRELARALLARGVDVRILPTDRHEGDAELVRLGLLGRCVGHAQGADVHLRNAWPPETAGMAGRRNGLVCWAWEESEIPPLMARRFNRDLDLILTTSSYVSEALRRSGVTIPCPVVGNGADHVIPLAPARPTRPARKRLLHLSTGLPRKAPEILVRAFVDAFRGRDDVELYIKTSPNPHNRFRQIVEEAQAEAAAPPSVALDPWSLSGRIDGPAQARGAAPPMLIDERALSAAEIAGLYAGATAVVLASRGEGFGLPLAEAMMLGVPVIAARHGGQADFCTDETALLVDSRPARSLSHVASAYGLWEEPDVEGLGQAMRQAVDEPARTRALAERGREHARRRLTWASVADRVIRSLQAPAASAIATAQAPAYELVSTWNEACGLATYSEQFYATEAMRPGPVRIWARRPLGEAAPASDDARVTRLWGYDGAALQRFADAVGGGAAAPVLWFQHHPGYFSGDDMRRAVPALRRGRDRLLITLHNVSETIAGGPDWLRQFDEVIVHSAQDVEALGRVGVRAEVLPHGVRVLAEPHKPTRGRFTVGTFGFLTLHKNIELLVAAFALARRSDPRLRLVLANAERRETQSRVAKARVEALIVHYGLDKVVTRRFDFVPDDEVVRLLSPCDLLVFPYGESLEGASGAARMAVALDRPTLLSQSAVLADMRPFSHVLRRLDMETLAEAILGLAQDDPIRTLHDRARRRYAETHAWDVVAQRAAQLMRPRG